MAKKKTQSRKKPQMIEARFPKEGKKRPFVLMWVEKAAAERLIANNLVSVMSPGVYDVIFVPEWLKELI